MKRSTLLMLLGGVAGALVASEGALAAYSSGKLAVRGSSQALGAQSTETIRFSFAPTDDPTAKTSIFVPRGYRATFGQPVGTELGTAAASVLVGDLNNAQVNVSGTVKTENPSTFADTAVQCTGSPTHQAVWTLNMQAANQPVIIPIFVDEVTSGPEAAFARVELQICFAPPDVPEGTPGRSPRGAKVFAASLSVKNVFKNPTSRGDYRWVTLLTPYVPGAGEPNIAGTVESRAVVSLPAQLTLTPKLDKRKKNAALTGKLAEAGNALGGIAVQLLTGGSAKALKAAGSATTSDSGGYRFTVKVKKKKTFVATKATVADRDITSSGCASPIAPGGCLNATLMGYTISSRVVVVKR